MKLSAEQLQEFNEKNISEHQDDLDALTNKLSRSGIDISKTLKKLETFNVAIPSWALGAGGTRFGRFSFGGEPATLEDKINDIGILNALTQSAGAVSLHIPWDIPSDYNAIKEIAAEHNIIFDAVNSNTFQYQPNAIKSYKFGSLSNINQDIRDQSLQHNQVVIALGEKLRSKRMTAWLGDRSDFPGQNKLQTAFSPTSPSLREICMSHREDRKLFLEDR